MAKKTVRTRQVIETEEVRQGSLSKKIRQYITEGGEFPEELLEYMYQVTSIQRWDETNLRWVKLAGRTVETIENLHELIGAVGGSGRYRLFINVCDDEGVKKTFVRIDEYLVEYVGEKKSSRNDEALDVTTTMQVQLQREQQAHEIRMREMDNQKEVLIAAMNQKQSGGIKASEVLTILETGLTIGAGQTLKPGAPGETIPEMMMRFIETDAGKLVVKILESKMVQEPGLTIAPANGAEKGK